MKLCFIEEGKQLLEEAEQCFLDLEGDRESIPTLEKLFRIAHNIKGTSRAVGFSQVAEFTHEFENLLLQLKEGRRHVTQPCIDIMLACNDAVKVMIESLAQNLDAQFDNSELIERLKTYMATPDNAEEAPVEVATEHGLSDDVTPRAEQFAEIPLSLVRPAADVQELASLTPPTPPKAAAQNTTAAAIHDESIRVSLQRLEKLSDYIGELVILQTVLDQHSSELASPLLVRTVSQLGKLSKEIQDISLSLRMIPLKQTFAKLQRIVRDTGRALGKEIDLTIDGDQTEVDKTVLENLSDPLVHIVRNAIDHGLETTDERLSAGKDRAGKVWIRAFHKGNSLVIEVQDDGKGIDPGRLREKAIAKGLVRADAQMTRDECMLLLFKNGFSTKDQVSEISGRGVGLDVVKTNVEKMGGQIQLESQLGSGSVFRIVLPLTLAIVEGLICEVRDERFVVPLSSVREIVRTKVGDVHAGAGGGCTINLRGKVLPVFDLAAFLSLKKEGAETENTQPVILVAASRNGEFGVIIDEIVRQQQIVIKKLGQELAGKRGIVGSAILGDGKQALIIDLNDLVDNRKRTHGQLSA
ncbi:MAG: chemotaxis protein CheA [Bdellovibrionales bacterium]|nr:chemotaxis protein CheA [Bdellovibrionales bacterium]